MNAILSRPLFLLSLFVLVVAGVLPTPVSGNDEAIIDYSDLYIAPALEKAIYLPQIQKSLPFTYSPLMTPKLSAGGYHTCAVTGAGGVKCWGSNSMGQIGDDTVFNRSEAVNVYHLSADVTAIAAGEEHTCALMKNGSVKCWGSNQYNQLGLGSDVFNKRTPVTVPALDEVVVGITAGCYHTCAVTKNGGVKCWGDNRDGQLGDGSTESRWNIVDVSGINGHAIGIAAGKEHTCILTDSYHSIQCWGSNSYGQVGDGSFAQRLVPVAVIGVNGGARTVAPGGSHTCAVTGNGSAKCWGANAKGQLGDGTNTIQPLPVDVLGLDSGFLSITSGESHSCALIETGGVMCWGRNDIGQVGNGTIGNWYWPVDVYELTSGVIWIAAGKSHTCAMIESGGIKCWGSNSSGQVGDGIPYPAYVPVDVIGF